MKYIDITANKKKRYALGENEQVTFFMLNRSGDMTFTLDAPGAEAVIYALYTGKGEEKYSLTITQHHRAPKTRSSALVKSVLDDAASFAYTGTIRIGKKASQAEATQENRNLLLSSHASVETKPILEILNPEVICRHAATTSAPKEEQIFALASRGIPRTEAIRLIAEGFQKEILAHAHYPTLKR